METPALLQHMFLVPSAPPEFDFPPMQKPDRLGTRCVSELPRFPPKGGGQQEGGGATAGPTAAATATTTTALRRQHPRP